MRDLPADVQIDPQPPGFTADVAFNPARNLLHWEATLDTPDGPFDVTYGIILRGPDRRAMATALTSILATVWQTTELARIGRTDLLAYVRPDRHSRRCSLLQTHSVEI